jgi:hypothetical protein
VYPPNRLTEHVVLPHCCCASVVQRSNLHHCVEDDTNLWSSTLLYLLKLILWFFVSSDVIATNVQVADAALVGVSYSNQKDPTTYNQILLAGLAFQVASFVILLFILAAILYKARNSTKSIDRAFVLALLVAILAVYIRTCCRLAETAEGLMANLSAHEA